jgi:hypothetical protein
MAKGFPERRQRDEALITFITTALEKDPVGLKEQFGLTERDIDILDKRLRKGETYQAIGDALGLTKERIRQILLDMYGVFRRPEVRSAWDPGYEADRSGGYALSREISGVTLGDLLLSYRARKALAALGMRRLSDLVGKTRKELNWRVIGRTTFAEIEREIAEYGLSFRPTTGMRKDDAIKGTNE